MMEYVPLVISRLSKISRHILNKIIIRGPVRGSKILWRKLLTCRYCFTGAVDEPLGQPLYCFFMKATPQKPISKQELKILQLVALGYTSEKIGAELSIAKTTVQTHRRNMLRKTGFNNTQQLVGWGYRSKLLR